MAKKRGGLGRGLESLFEDTAPSFESDNRIETLPLREIEPDPAQPRKTFDEETLAELAASAEWQLHCFLWPQRSGADGLSLLLLVVVYGGVFGCIWVLEHKHKSPKGHIVISGKAALVAVVMAAMVFAVSNLLFLGDREVDMSVYYIRTLVDICGVLILTVQHEQLREAALHSELAAMDEVLHRQYEQYKRSKEGIRLINESMPSDAVIKLKSLEAFAAAADGRATKIIIPSELQGFAGLASGIAETVKETK